MAVFLLDGPSASGKTTLARALLEKFSGRLQFCRRLCTRCPRPGELDSPLRDYDFVTPEEFAAQKNAGGLAVWREFDFGMSYGLPRLSVERALQQGSVLALVDLGTAPQARQHWPYCIAILLCAPLPELERRLRERGGHSLEQIAERLSNAAAVLPSVVDYDYVVVNRPPHWEHALEQLDWIVSRHLGTVRPPLPADGRFADAKPE
ncbi:guanylate kinase [bacterium]|nr:guanylate kinase [bacterium]